MEPCKLEPGDVVQLNPATVGNKAFSGCLLVVTEGKPFGCQGYVQALGETRDEAGGRAFLRVKWGAREFVGKAVWMFE